ncbi:MAG: hypothetical protein RLZZ293_89 [Pseudomonadota bacterium]|jgi:hypothetical protein
MHSKLLFSKTTYNIPHKNIQVVDAYTPIIAKTKLVLEV